MISDENSTVCLKCSGKMDEEINVSQTDVWFSCVKHDFMLCCKKSRQFSSLLRFLDKIYTFLSFSLTLWSLDAGIEGICLDCCILLQLSQS